MISWVRTPDAEPNNLGAVVGYGLPLQGRCLEGFDSLGLHQVLAVGLRAPPATGSAD